MNKNIFQSAKVIALALALSLGISYVAAWTAPTSQPPAGSTAAPINAGGGTQTKSGNLGASWMYAYSYRDAGDPTDTYFMKPSGDSKLKKVIADTLCFGIDCKTAWPAGGVTSVSGGAGVSVSPATGNVVVSNTGVTSVNGQTGAVNVIIKQSQLASTFANQRTATFICYDVNGNQCYYLVAPDGSIYRYTAGGGVVSHSHTSIFTGDTSTGSTNTGSVTGTENCPSLLFNYNYGSCNITYSLLATGLMTYDGYRPVLFGWQ